MFVAYYCNGCSTAPLRQYKNNEIKQELTKEKDYFSRKFDERLYIDMRRSKGYTDELEKSTGNDEAYLKVKSSCHKKNEAKSNCVFTI